MWPVCMFVFPKTITVTSGGAKDGQQRQRPCKITSGKLVLVLTGAVKTTDGLITLAERH